MGPTVDISGSGSVFSLTRRSPERIMKFFASVLLLAAVSAATVCADDVVTPGPKPTTNDWADEILKNLKAMIVETGLDPLILPVKKFEFSKTILGVKIAGEAKVFDGFINGLSTIHRVGEATKKTDEDKTITVGATLAMDELTGQYKSEAKFMGFGPHFNIALGIKSIGVSFEVEKSADKDVRPQLLSFKIVDVGRITTEIDSDLNLLDWILNKFNNFVINIVKKYVSWALGPPMKILIQAILDRVDLPDLHAM